MCHSERPRDFGKNACLPVTQIRARSSLESRGRNGTPEKRDQRCKDIETGNEDILAMFEGRGTC